MQIDKDKPPRAARKVRRKQPWPAVEVRHGGEDEADRLHAKLKALGPEAEAFGQRLIVANLFDMWADCPHEPCRRAGKCRGEDVACFDERRPELTRKVLAHVVPLLCIANVSSDEFYDYLDEVTADVDDDGDDDSDEA